MFKKFFAPWGKWDDLMVRFVNWQMKHFVSKEYVNVMTAVVEVGMVEMSRQVLQTDVDYDQDALISADDVDDTARFITHPAWADYGDEIKDI